MNSLAETTAYFGANRCLAGETEIFDPVQNKYRIVSKIKDSFFVFAWSGERLVEAKAHVPFVKGYGSLFRVVLSNGKQITASGGHRILTPMGFVSVEKLRKGSIVCAPCAKKSEENTSLGISKQYHNLYEDGGQLLQDSTRTLHSKILNRSLIKSFDTFQDIQNQPNSGISSFDPYYQNQSILDTFRKVHISNVNYSSEKVLGFQFDYPAYSHSYDGQLQEESTVVQDVLPLQGGVHEHTSSYLDGQGSKGERNRIYRLDDHLSIEDDSCRHCKMILPDDIRAPLDTLLVKSVEYVREDFYYDFTVPIYHNYQDKSTLVSSNSGKSVAGAVKAIYHATGRYPDWWKARKFDGPTEGRIFAENYKKGAAIVIKKLKEWLPRDAYYCSPKKGNQGVEIDWFIKHVSGGVSHFDIMTYESDPFSAEGWDGDWIWFDEPPPRAMYIAAVRGLVDSEGLCWFSLTPLKEPWLFDEIYSSKNPNVFSVICDMRHNLERVNPLSKIKIGLTERAIRKFEMKLTEEERETRAHGKFRYLAGRIWKEWDRGVHTFDRFKEWPLDRKKGIIVAGEPPIHWPRAMLIDPHDRKPHALLWVACDDTGDYFAYREGFLADALPADIVRFCKESETFAKERILVRVLDPNFGPKRYGNTGLTVREEIEKAAKEQFHPMRFVFGNDNKPLGRKLFSALLRFDHTRPISFSNHPKFRAANDLKEFIYQIEHYIWDEFKATQNRDPKDKPKDINNDFPDLCHYLSLAKFEQYKAEVYEGCGDFYGTNRMN